MQVLHRDPIPSHDLGIGDRFAKSLGLTVVLLALQHAYAAPTDAPTPDWRRKPRVIVTSDGETDDQGSLVRFLLYTNEWDVEGIVTSSSHA